MSTHFVADRSYCAPGQAALDSWWISILTVGLCLAIFFELVAWPQQVGVIEGREDRTRTGDYNGFCWREGLEDGEPDLTENFKDEIAETFTLLLQSCNFNLTHVCGTKAQTNCLNHEAFRDLVSEAGVGATGGPPRPPIFAISFPPHVHHDLSRYTLLHLHH